MVDPLFATMDVQIQEASGWVNVKCSRHEVLGSNLARGRIHLMTMVLHCTKPFIVTLLSSRYDLNNIARDAKHQTIIIQTQRWKNPLQKTRGQIPIITFVKTMQLIPNKLTYKGD